MENNTNSFKPIKRQSFREEVYNALKQAITQLELQPEERIHDKELAEKFGISRTPVREAIKRLEDEGLIESIPGSATRVAPLNYDVAKHSYTVIAALHSLAARLAVPLLTEEDLHELELANEQFLAAIQAKETLAAIHADERFHRVFLQVAANPEIIRCLEPILPKIQRLEIAQFDSLNNMNSYKLHQQIIAATKEKDITQVEMLVEENWLSLGAHLHNGRVR